MKRWTMALVGVVVVALAAVLLVVLTRGSGSSTSTTSSSTSPSTSPPTSPPTSTGSTGSTKSSSTPTSASPSTDDPDDPAYDAAVSTPREDSVYPQHGDPGIDTLHYGLDLAWDPTSKILTGRADIALRAVRTASRLRLDLRRDLHVSSVTVDGAAATYAQTQDDQLVVRAPVTANRRYDVVVAYAGHPRRAWSPSTRQDMPFLGLQIGADGSLWTMQEPYGAFTWYPVNDQPADKALYDITLHAPGDEVGIANGVLTSRTTAGDQTTTTWHLDRPASSYLITMAMGDYDETRATGPDGTPLTYWTKVGDTRSLAALKVTPQVMAWNEAHLGAFPFDSLGLVVVDSDSAMETETMITLGDTAYTLSAPVIEHEMAHQWYGDLVTPADWRDVWMNEGMVMFLQLAYQADRDGVPVDRVVGRQRATEAYSRFEAGPPGDYKVGRFGDGNIYYGPAIMWNKIRHRLGDQRFWAMVRAWPRVHRYGNATRAQYLRWLDRYTGIRHLDRFVRAWLMDKRTPTRLAVP